MIRIGKIAATHGLKGTVIFTHMLPDSNWLIKETPLFIALRKDSRIPFFIASLKADGADAYHLLLEEVDDVEAARKLVGKAVYVASAAAGKAAADTPLLWIGFCMKDAAGRLIGEVEDVFQTPAQWLAQVRHNNNEVLVPLIPEVLKSVDLTLQTLTVDLPEGLLEVYS